MPLTGPDNPLLCHYFCYYLKWVCDNEMFTAGNTLSCSYGGLGEEIRGLEQQEEIRGLEQQEDEAMAASPASWSQGSGADALHRGVCSHLQGTNWQ